MNDVRVRPVREAGRVVCFAVDVRKDGAFENVGWFSSWDTAHTFAHSGLKFSVGATRE